MNKYCSLSQILYIHNRVKIPICFEFNAIMIYFILRRIILEQPYRNAKDILLISAITLQKNILSQRHRCQDRNITQEENHVAQPLLYRTSPKCC
ncbi:hypothetical protein HBA_0008 [Sodalis endosymbiont of Henestaris halophilus]|nr:hypothetical protein HBA_0008 [Sodalis endosymbiont of Henestaris halophilus]